MALRTVANFAIVDFGESSSFFLSVLTMGYRQS